MNPSPEDPCTNASQTGFRSVVCSPAHSSASELREGGVLPLHRGTEQRLRGAVRPDVSQTSAPSPDLCSEVRLEYHSVHRTRYFPHWTLDPPNLPFSQCFPSPRMPPAPQTSSSRPVGITYRPRLHMPAVINLLLLDCSASLKHARFSPFPLPPP